MEFGQDGLQDAESTVMRQPRMAGMARRAVRRFLPERSPRRGDPTLPRPAVVDRLQRIRLSWRLRPFSGHTRSAFFKEQARERRTHSTLTCFGGTANKNYAPERAGAAAGWLAVTLLWRFSARFQASGALPAEAPTTGAASSQFSVCPYPGACPTSIICHPCPT